MSTKSSEAKKPAGKISGSRAAWTARKQPHGSGKASRKISPDSEADTREHTGLLYGDKADVPSPKEIRDFEERLAASGKTAPTLL